MKKIIKLNINLKEAAGVDPRDIAIIYGDKIYTSSQNFSWNALIDLDDLPSWGDVANPREFYLGGVTYTPQINENGDVTSIDVKWGDPLEYGGYCYLYPIKGVEVEYEVNRELIEKNIRENKLNQKARPTRRKNR